MMISNMRAKGAFWDGLHDGRGRYRTKIPKKQTSCCMLFLSHSHATSFKLNASKMLCSFPSMRRFSYYYTYIQAEVIS